MNEIKHYLVERGPEGVRRIDVFNHGGEAMKAYTDREHTLGVGVIEVCLFGADSLLTLCRTHASWLAPETIDPWNLEIQHGGSNGP